MEGVPWYKPQITRILVYFRFLETREVLVWTRTNQLAEIEGKVDHTYEQQSLIIEM